MTAPVGWSRTRSASDSRFQTRSRCSAWSILQSRISRPSGDQSRTTMSPSGASAGRSRRAPDATSQTNARSRPDALVVAARRRSSRPGANEWTWMPVPGPSQSSGPGSPRAVSAVRMLCSTPFERWADENAAIAPSALRASAVRSAAEWCTVWRSPTRPSSPMTATRTASRSSDAVMNPTRAPCRLNAICSDAYGASLGLRSIASPPRPTGSRPSGRSRCRSCPPAT